MPFENLFEICTMAFGIILCHFQHSSLAMALVQILSPKPPLIFGSCFASTPASCTSPYNPFHSKHIQTNFCLLFYPLVIYKGTLLSVWIFVPKPTPLPSPLNPQPRSMKIHWSSVQKISNYTCCKFGPDLSNLVKFIQIFLQKFQVKSGSLWVHWVVTSPTYSPRKFIS